jgi:hypothetical protein
MAEPEDVSRRGNPITTSGFETPFETPIFPIGVGGVDLIHAIDAVAVGDFTRLTNWSQTLDNPRALTGRPGQTAVAAAGTDIHSIFRLNDPEHAMFTRVWGVDGALYVGESGGLSAVDSGYSGYPLTIVSARPPFSGTAWAYIGDFNKMSKVAPDGTVKEIGVGAPPFVPTTAVSTPLKKVIADFTTPPTSNGWTPNAGVVDDPNAKTPGESTGVPPAPVNGLFATLSNPFFGTLGAWTSWGIALTANLDDYGAVGSPPVIVRASDDDLMHLAVTFVQPWVFTEVRLYVVVGGPFSPSILPGTDATYNTNFYLKTLRPGDFSVMIQPGGSQADVAELARVIAVRNDALNRQATAQGFAKVQAGQVIKKSDTFLAQFDPSLIESIQAGASSGATVEFGISGNPLRRGDFQRFGNNVNVGWGTVVGLFVYIHYTGSSAVSNFPSVTLKDWWLTGGYGPDTTDVAASSYDYRYTHFDTRCGVESNPSPIMVTSQLVDAARNAVTLTPTPKTLPDIVQRFYRRGGTLPTDWFFLGQNTADGAPYIDILSDQEIAAAQTLEIDHYQPVASTNDAGLTTQSNVRVLLGPVNGQLLALGDALRPGTVYASRPDNPDLWPSDLSVEACPPSEELMNGAIIGSQPYVFSRERMYVVYLNLFGANGLTANPTDCVRGLAGYWSLCTGYGRIWFMARDGGYSTAGAGQTLFTTKIQPLFEGQTVNGYAPIDFFFQGQMRMVAFQQEIWMSFQGTDGRQHVWVFEILTEQWRHYLFGAAPSALYEDQGGGERSTLFIGGASTGKAYTHDGTSDDGAAIAWSLRTGSWDWGKPREEKLFGDQILDIDLQGNALTWTNFVNSETVVNPAVTIDAGTGRSRIIFDGFGTGPQIGRNLAIDIAGTSSVGSPIAYLMGTSITLQPDLTVNRVTNWDDLGHPDPKYLTGVTFDVDTGGVDRTILIEYDWLGVVSLAATLLVNTTGRHKVAFTWPAVRCHQVRIRPNDDCLAWLLYRADWIAVNEPPMIAGWDIYFENKWDQYYTGLDLEVDTLGLLKTIVIQVDGVTLNDPATGLGFFPVQTDGRKVVHLTLPWGRGHVFHFVATDANPGQLFEHRWFLVDEPSEQHNWNQPFTILGSRADKWLKAVVFECDTFGQDKSVTIEADGVVVETLVVNTNGRKVVQLALPTGEKLGRVWRFFPVDHQPSRLYSLQPIFDEEPFALARWETQEIDHDQPGFHTLVAANITIKSTTDVLLTLTTYLNQHGAAAVDTYVIPSTNNLKVKTFLPFGATAVGARKGILYKYVFTAPTPFWLYREESEVTVQPWNGGDPQLKKPWGNDDLDLTRSMTNAVGAAQRSGGGTA